MKPRTRVVLLLVNLCMFGISAFNLYRFRTGADLPLMPWQGEVSAPAQADRPKLGHPELLDFRSPVRQIVRAEDWGSGPRKHTLTISRDGLQATDVMESKGKREVTQYQVKGNIVEIRTDGKLTGRVEFSGLCLSEREDFRYKDVTPEIRKCDEMGRTVFSNSGYMQETTVWSRRGRKSISHRHTNAISNLAARDETLTGYFDNRGNVVRGFGAGMYAEWKYKYDSHGNWIQSSSVVPSYVASSNEPVRRAISYY